MTTWFPLLVIFIVLLSHSLSVVLSSQYELSVGKSIDSKAHSSFASRWCSRGGGDDAITNASMSTYVTGDDPPASQSHQNDISKEMKKTIESNNDNNGVHKQIGKSVLGRAVLTTPHRQIQAVRIAPAPRPSFLSPENPGPLMIAEPMLVTKFSLSESLGCAFRDLRVIDPFLMTTGSTRYSGPAFLTRKNCVIVHVGHVRAIVMRDQVLMFPPELTSDKNAVIEKLITALVQHLNSIYHYNSHHLSFDDAQNPQHGEENIAEVQLMKQGTTAAGQRWGSGWYSGSAIDDMHTKKHKSIFRKKNNKKGNRSYNKEYEMNIPPTAPPFELVVIEALLGHVCSNESTRVAKLLDNANDILEGIGIGGQRRLKEKKQDAFLQMQTKLGDLLRMKNKVDEFESQCSEVAAAIAEVLKNDEDMAAMKLSYLHSLRGGKYKNSNHIPDVKKLHVEVELLFEDYLLQMEEVLHSLRSVQSSVRNTEEVVEIELDLLRNRIMRYEMLLELSGLVVGIAAAITGAFGMNLINHFEDHPTLFYQVCIGIILIMGVMGMGILNKLSYDNIL